MPDSKAFIISQLEANIEVFKGLLTNLDEEMVMWKPTSDRWCMLEIVCHLIDEEIHDFRARVGAALDADQYPFYAIDPVGWVTERKYIEQDYTSKVNEWINERTKSIDWLRSLDNPDWENSFQHPDFGPVSASHFLSNWLAHDHIHVRQINRTKRTYLEHISDENLEYAGKWNPEV